MQHQTRTRACQRSQRHERIERGVPAARQPAAAGRGMIGDRTRIDPGLIHGGGHGRDGIDRAEFATLSLVDRQQAGKSHGRPPPALHGAVAHYKRARPRPQAHRDPARQMPWPRCGRAPANETRNSGDFQETGCPARIRTSIDGVRVRSLTVRRRGNRGLPLGAAPGAVKPRQRRSCGPANANRTAIREGQQPLPRRTPLP